MKQMLSRLTYAELLMAMLLVLAGMGFWALADSLAGRFLLNQAPRQENYEAAAGVPMLQARRDGDLADLQAVQAELAARQMASLQAAGQIEALENTYPQLAAKRPELEKLVALQKDALDGYAAAAVQAAQASSLETMLAGQWQDLVNQQQALSAQKDPGAAERLALVQAQLAAVQAKLVDQKMAVVQQQAAVAAYLQLYPELAALPVAAQPPNGISPQIGMMYLDLLRAEQDAQMMVVRLGAHQGEIEKRLDEADRTLEDARRQAQTKYQMAQQSQSYLRRGLALGGSILVTALFFLVPGLFAVKTLLRVIRKDATPPKDANPWPAVELVGAITLILLGYQAFEIIGAVIAGLIVLLCALALSRRRATAAPAAQTAQEPAP